MVRHCTHVASGAARRAVELLDSDPILLYQQPQRRRCLCLAVCGEVVQKPRIGDFPPFQVADLNGGDYGNRTRRLCCDRATKDCNYLKSDGVSRHGWYYKGALSNFSCPLIVPRFNFVAALAV